MIVGGVLILSVGALLPETAKSIVGNGKRQNWWEESWWTLIRRCFKERRKGEERATSRQHVSRRPQIPNPLACLRIIFYWDTFLCLWMHGSFYAVDYSLAAAVPDIYKDIYKFNELQIGLSYLPRGGGIIVGGYCNGKLMDCNYRYIARQVGWTVNRVSGDDLSRFPIERAWSRGSLILLAISTATLIGYGWAVTRHAHVSIPLILQFVQGFWGTCFYTTYNTLLVDLFPESPSNGGCCGEHHSMCNGCRQCCRPAATDECSRERLVLYRVGGLEWELWGCCCLSHQEEGNGSEDREGSKER